MGRRKEHPKSRSQITIDAQQLDALARFAGYQGDDPHVFDRLNDVLQKQGPERYQDYFKSYIEGIKFLKDHPNGFNRQELMSATMKNDLTGGPGLATLAELHNAINYTHEAERPKDQVRFFIDRLLPPIVKK